MTTIAVSEKLPVTTTMKTQPKPTPEPELESVAMNRTVKDAAKVMLFQEFNSKIVKFKLLIKFL